MLAIQKIPSSSQQQAPCESMTTQTKTAADLIFPEKGSDGV